MTEREFVMFAIFLTVSAVIGLAGIVIAKLGK